MTLLFLEIAAVGVFLGIIGLTIGHYVTRILALVEDTHERLVRLEIAAQRRESQEALRYTVYSGYPTTEVNSAKLRN